MPKRKAESLVDPRISTSQQQQQHNRNMWNSISKRSNVTTNNKKNTNTNTNKNSNRANPPKSKFSREEAESLWSEIADADTVATMEGISTLCQKLDLDPLEDVRVLVLLWRLGATAKPGQITQEEWMKGCQTLGVDNISKFQQHLVPSLDTGFLDQDEFKDFYKVRACLQYSTVLYRIVLYRVYPDRRALSLK
jgi:hypothetical protein